MASRRAAWLVLAGLLAGLPGCAPAAGPGRAFDGVLVVSGTFSRDGKALLQRGPVVHRSWTSGVRPLASRGKFAVRVRLAGGGEITAPFDALVASQGGIGHGYFEVVVPVNGVVESVRITDAAGGEVFAEISPAEIE